MNKEELTKLKNKAFALSQPTMEGYKSLVVLAKEADKAYYEQDNPFLSDKEYDAIFDKIKKFEDALGVALSTSPTQKVSGKAVDGLEKVVHTKPMLSCKKTKQDADLKSFVKVNNDCILSYKMDGLTLVIRYKNGELTEIITRGDGDTGENVTHNVAAIKNLPRTIPCKEDIEVRGECVISWADFNDINANSEREYSHPRNLASGSVRLLDPSEASKRNLQFIAFELVEPKKSSVVESYKMLDNLGFDVVKHEHVNFDTVIEAKALFKPKDFTLPVDGLVLEYNDKNFGKSLGATGHHENCRIAFKWADDTYETIFRGVEVTPTRTGRLSLTAVFDPVEIDGSIVKKATLHNVDFFENLKLGIGDIIKVYKSNMIIPAIDENVTKSGTYQLPDTCPVCGAKAEVQQIGETRYLVCTNDNCSSKLLRKIEHWSSKDCMDIDGLSEKTLEAFLNANLLLAENCTTLESIKSMYDIKASQIEGLPGFGKKSAEKLVAAIADSKNTTVARFIAALGIPEVGRHAGKILNKTFQNMQEILDAVNSNFDFSTLEDFGEISCNNLVGYLKQCEADIKNLASMMNFKEVSKSESSTSVFTGKTIVATGSFEHFTRDSINAKIEFLGAKAGSSVSKKTDYVVAGPGAGSKLEKANALGIKVLTEDEFLSMIS